MNTQNSIWLEGKEYKLVPVEPTIEMMTAMSGEWHPSRHSKTREQYRVMLNAAPEAPAQTSDLEDQLKDALQSLEWHKRRVDLLQQWQSKMRDPERTIVCDILANGQTLEPAGDRYTVKPEAPAQVLDKVAVVDCPECGGEGVVIDYGYGNAQEIVCPTCKGSALCPAPGITGGNA